MSRRKPKEREEFLWVEKYRPKSLKDCILPDALRAQLDSIVEGGELPNLLLSGGAGIGKTTVAKAICKDLNMDVLVINASKDGNIDTLRTSIQSFAMVKSFEGKKKCVILDEADYLNPQSTQPALRNFIEEYSHNCRFIFTCNYPKKILPALHSRLTALDFTFTKKDQMKMAGKFLTRFTGILDSEGVTYEKSTVAQLIMKYTPDYRKMINELQGVCADGDFAASDISTLGSDNFDELAKWISTKKFTKCRKWVAENSDIGFAHFMKIRVSLEPLLSPESVPELFILLNDFDKASGDVSDLEIHMVACIAVLMSELEYTEDG